MIEFGSFLWHLFCELWQLVLIMATGFHGFMFLAAKSHGLTYSKKLTEQHMLEHNIASLLAIVGGVLAAPVFIVHLTTELTLENEAPIDGMWQTMEQLALFFALLYATQASKHLRFESLKEFCGRYFR